MPQKEAITPGEKIVYDGVTYSISVQQVGQHYHASWLAWSARYVATPARNLKRVKRHSSGYTWG